MPEAPRPQGPEPPRLPAERPGPRGGKRDRNRRARTRALLDAALELFLARGIEPVTIEAIASAAGLAKGSFYRYFQDKRTLVEALLAPTRRQVTAAFAACRAALEGARDPAAVFAAYLGLGLALQEAIAGAPQVARLYLQESRAPAVGARAPVAALAREVAAAAVELTELAQAHGLLRKVDPRVSALAVVGAAERLLQAFFSDELAPDGAAVTRDLVTIALEGLHPTPSRDPSSGLED